MLPFHNLVMFPRGVPSFTFGIAGQELAILQHSLGDCRAQRYETHQLHHLVPRTVSHVSLFLGTGLTDVAPIRPILSHLAHNCPSISSLYINLRAEIWTRFTHLYDLFLSSATMVAHFHFHVHRPDDDYAIYIFKGPQGTVTTNARIPLNALDLDILADMHNLPGLTRLEVGAPTATLDAVTLSNIAQCLAQRIGSFHTLRALVLPLELLSHLEDVLYEALTLPYCVEMEFVASASFQLDPTTSSNIISALRRALDGVGHIQKVVLPLDLHRQLQGSGWSGPSGRTVFSSQASQSLVYRHP